MIGAPNSLNLNCKVRVTKEVPGPSVSEEIADILTNYNIDYVDRTDQKGREIDHPPFWALGIQEHQCVSHYSLGESPRMRLGCALDINPWSVGPIIVVWVGQTLGYLKIIYQYTVPQI